MQNTATAWSSSSWVSGRLVWALRSSPTYFSAQTELSVAGWPRAAAMPAETTLSERSGSGWAASACWSSFSPMGLRQMLAVQTTMTRPGSDMGSGVVGNAAEGKQPAVDEEGALEQDILQRW